MKRILFLLVLLCMEKALHAQYVYTIKADSVKITNSCDTAELIIENHTQTVPGFLYNKGRGRTEFRRVLQNINDTLVTIGPDTLRIPFAWIQGGNRWNTTGVFGTLDNNPVDFYTNNTRQGRWTNTGNLLLGSITDTGNYKLNVNGMLRAGSNSLIGAADEQGITGNETGLKVIGNFQVTTAKIEGVYGGFKIYSHPWARPGTTGMSLNNFGVVAYDAQMHFGTPNSKFFSVNAASSANLFGGPVTRTKYTIGNNSDPAGWNDSYAMFGVSNENEFNLDNAYPSRENYYRLETGLNGPRVAANTGQVGVRAPLSISARQIWFSTGDAPAPVAARFTEGGNLLINTANDFGDKLHVAGGFVQEAGRSILAGDFTFDQTTEGCVMSSYRNLVYKSINTGDQHLFVNTQGNLLKGTVFTIDAGGNSGQTDSQVVFKVKNKFGALGLTVTMGGKVGVGTVPTANLHAMGTIRFPDLASNNSLTRVVVCDADGNLFYKDVASTFNGTMNSDLAVNGTVSAQKMLIAQTGRWPDYVFSKQYHLPSLAEVENFINQNSHLPGMPSAAEVEKKGIDVADTQAALLKKVEELTLYVIELEKKSQKQSEEIGELKKMIKKNK